MRTRSWRPALPIKRVLTVACLVAVVSALLSTSSSSAPGDPTPGQDDLLPPGQVSLSQGVTTLTQGAVVRRSKMYITINKDAPMWGIVHPFLYNTPVDNPTSYLPGCTRGRPCIANPFHQPACATDDIATQRRGQYFRSFIFPLSPLKGGGADVGLLAKIRVNLSAFGSIPATATLTLRAPRVNGRVQPFVAHMWQTMQVGCDPDFSAPDVDALVEGKVNLSLSDLTVDGVPVALGARCRTVRPLELALWGDTASGGYFPADGGALGAYDGLHRGSIGRLDSPYYSELQGRTIPASTGVTVPPFTGCGVTEDLDPLITAMASGPNNPVRAGQGMLAFWDAGIDLNNLGACDPQGRCPRPAPDVSEMPPLPDGD